MAEIFGVPPHGWKWENFQQISEFWGRLVCLGKSIARTYSFVSMKFLIDIDIFYNIHGDFILTLGDYGYRVIVKEVGPMIQVTQKFSNTI